MNSIENLPLEVQWEALLNHLYSSIKKTIGYQNATAKTASMETIPSSWTSCTGSKWLSRLLLTVIPPKKVVNALDKLETTAGVWIMAKKLNSMHNCTGSFFQFIKYVNQRCKSGMHPLNCNDENSGYFGLLKTVFLSTK